MLLLLLLPRGFVIFSALRMGGGGGGDLLTNQPSEREREREKKQKNKAVVRALCDVCVRYGSEIKEPTPTPSPLLLPKQIRFLNTLAL